MLHRFPSLGQDDAFGVQRVSCHDVLDAPRFLAGGPHRLGTGLHEPVPLVGIERERSLDNHFAHTSLIGDGPPSALRELSSAEFPVGGLPVSNSIYVTNTSLDGYIEDPDGGISWGDPDQEYFGFINEIQRSAGTYLYGRRMYEAMVYWETAPVDEQPPPGSQTSPPSGAGQQGRVLEDPCVRIERADHAAAGVRCRGDSADESGGDRDLTVGGADLAAQAMGRVWSTTATCSSGRSCLAGARSRSPDVDASTLRCSTSAVSEAESSNSTTGSSTEELWRSSSADGESRVGFLRARAVPVSARTGATVPGRLGNSANHSPAFSGEFSMFLLGQRARALP